MDSEDEERQRAFYSHIREAIVSFVRVLNLCFESSMFKNLTVPHSPRPDIPFAVSDTLSRLLLDGGKIQAT